LILKKKEGILSTRMVLLGIFISLSSIFLSPRFSVTSVDASYSMDFDIGEATSDGQILF